MLKVVALLGWLSAQEAAPGDLTNFINETPRCGGEIGHCFGIHLHVVVDSGAPIQTVVWVRDQLDALNHRFAVIDVNFEIVAATPLAAGALEIDSRAERDALGEPHFTRGVAHVFVVGRLADVDVAGSEIRGVHWRFRGDRARRWVILSRIAGPLVLAHELGHFFGLPHSDYDISVMNKTPRPPPAGGAELSFAEPEFARMRAHRNRMLRDGMLINSRPAASARPAPR